MVKPVLTITQRVYQAAELVKQGVSVEQASLDCDINNNTLFTYLHRADRNHRQQSRVVARHRIVQELTAQGVPIERIAKELRLTERTIRKYQDGEHVWLH